MYTTLTYHLFQQHVKSQKRRPLRVLAVEMGVVTHVVQSGNLEEIVGLNLNDGIYPHGMPRGQKRRLERERQALEHLPLVYSSMWDDPSPAGASATAASSDELYNSHSEA